MKIELKTQTPPTLEDLSQATIASFEQYGCRVEEKIDLNSTLKSEKFGDSRHYTMISTETEDMVSVHCYEAVGEEKKSIILVIGLFTIIDDDARELMRVAIDNALNNIAFLLGCSCFSIDETRTGPGV